MDGVLLIDKPAGPTSHDVVARLRSVCGERSVGHTGTLDPLATGLLPLVLGKATRLAAVLTGGDKTYEAVIRLGVETDTSDAEGVEISAATGQMPDSTAIETALSAFRGTFEQLPPAHSAKRIGGRKAYELARQSAPIELKPVSVTVRRLDVGGLEGADLSIAITCTAGFYVRALARDLGRALGCGAHLRSLRRTRVGRFDVADALPLGEAERLGEDVARYLLSPAEALADLPSVRLNDAGLRRAVHGNPLGPEHLTGRAVPPSTGSAGGRVCILGPDGRLVALAHSRGGALHPAVVLG